MSYIPPARTPPGPPIIAPPAIVPPARVPPGTPPAGGPPPSPYPGYPPPPVAPPAGRGPAPGYIAPTYAYGDQHWDGGFGFDAAMRLARGQDLRHMTSPGYTPPPPGVTPLPTLPGRIDPATILPGTPAPAPPGRTPPAGRGLPAGAIGDFGTLPSGPAPSPVRAVVPPPGAPPDSRTGVPSPVAAPSPHPTIANTNGQARQAAYEAQQSAVPIPAQAVVPARATPAIAPPVSVPLQQRPAPSVPTLPNAAPLAVPSPVPPVGV